MDIFEEIARPNKLECSSPESFSRLLEYLRGAALLGNLILGIKNFQVKTL
jgi:hypothetical protein